MFAVIIFQQGRSRSSARTRRMPAPPRTPAGRTGPIRVARPDPPPCVRAGRRGTFPTHHKGEPMTDMDCLWCGTEFEPRSNGGKPQRFCSAPCRRAFDTACRVYAAAEVEAGRLPVSALKMALEQRARSLGRDPASESTQASETETRPVPPPRGAEPESGITP